MVKVELVGCNVYSLKGVQYHRNQVTLVAPHMAQVLLSKKDHFGVPYFKSADPKAEVASTAVVDYTLKVDRAGRRMYDDHGNKIPTKKRDAFMDSLAAEQVTASDHNPDATYDEEEGVDLED